MTPKDTKAQLYSINLTDNPSLGHEITVVREDEAINVSSESGKPEEKPKPPLLNRAQRRSLGRYIRHKAALQARHVLAKRRRMAVKAEKQAKALAKQAKYAAGIIS